MTAKFLKSCSNFYYNFNKWICYIFMINFRDKIGGFFLNVIINLLLFNFWEKNWGIKPNFFSTICSENRI